MPSGSARRYGRLAERRAREKYGLIEDRGSWHDARYRNGTPVEIKGAQPEWHFRLWEDEHHALASQQGYYVFVSYTPRGRGISVQGMKRVRAAGLGISWGPSRHRDKQQRQAKIPVSQIFT